MAAKCFTRLANRFSGQQSAQRIQRGNNLRNAALAYQKAAKKAKLSRRKAYLNECGFRLMQNYLKEKLYSTETQKRIAKGMLDAFEEKIGYVSLTVLTPHPKAAIQIIGYRIHQKIVGGGVLRVRPGEFTILVRYPDKKQDARTVKLTSGKPRIVRFKLLQAPKVRKPQVVRVLPRKTQEPRRLPPPPTPRRSVVGPWIVASVGVASVIGGAVLVGVSVVSTGPQAEARLRTAIDKGEVQLTREAGALYQGAQSQNLAGWIMGGVGLTTLGAGLVWMILQPSKRPSSQTAQVFSSSQVYATQKDVHLSLD